jgi:hypothetical protein
MSYSLLILTMLLALSPALPAAAEVALFDKASFSGSLPEAAFPEPVSAAVDPSAGPEAKPLPLKDYTIMLFMNGKNNLAPMMVGKLVELEKLGSDKRLNIVMQLGITKLNPACAKDNCVYPYGADWEGVRRYYVRKTGGPGRGIEASTRLPDPQNQDMGDYRALVDFALWAKRLLPARHYILVIGNHGGAWVDKPKPAAQKGVSYDDVTKNYITTPEIGLAMRALGGAEVLIFDDCLMQAAEVASEIGTSATFIAGSEEISYTNHFQPALYFGPLKENPAMRPETFVYTYQELTATHMAKLWATTGKYPGTASILFTPALAGFNGLVRQYAAAAKDLVERNQAAKAAYISAMKEVLRYQYKSCVDFHDFLRLSQEKLAVSVAAGDPRAANVNALAERIKTSITADLTPYNFAIGMAEGKDYARSKGVSIYLPYLRAGVPDNTPPVFMVASSRLQTRYNDLTFAKATGWDLFINALTEK